MSLEALVNAYVGGYMSGRVVNRIRVTNEYQLTIACSNGTFDETMDVCFKMAKDKIHKHVDLIWYEAMRKWNEQNINYDLRRRHERL